MTRIFVRNISNQASQEDLVALFSKVSPVSEIYIPGQTETTLRRNFAIITIEGDETEGKKCVKALNGSMWKGSKLAIEVANEYYKDRIVREKEDEVDRLYNLSVLAQQSLVVEPLPQVTNEIIKLRRNRFQELPHAISMQPSIGDNPTKPKKNPKKVIVPCGVKLIFDEDMIPHGRVNYTEDSESESELEMAKALKTIANANSLPDGLGNDMAKIVSKLNSGEVKPIGGGLRKGFGTMSIPANIPATNQPAPAPKTVHAFVPAHKVDCCIVPEHDHVPSHLLDEDEQSVEDVPCITEEELTEEVLQGDRSRALDIFNNLVIGPDGLVVPINKKKIARDAAKEAARAAKEALKPPVTAIETSASAAASVPVAEKDTKKAGLVVAEPAHGEDEFMIELDTKIEVSIPKKDTAEAAKATAKKDTNKTANKSEVTTPTPIPTEEAEAVAAAGPEDILNVKDGYANMNVLKNIFYREGGVWWGDDGTLSGAVGKGSAALDPLFLEAEKHGIDIRTAKKINASAAAMSMSTENSAAGAAGTAAGGLFGAAVTASLQASAAAAVEEEPVEEEKQMVFGFFAPSQDDAAALPVNPFLASVLTTSTTTEGMDSLLTTEGGTTEPSKDKDNKPTVARANTMHDADEAGTSAAAVAYMGRPVDIGFTAAQLVGLAKKFSRDRTVDELTTEWREGRDRLVLDYKRKRKDMKRRTAAWSNSNTGPTTSSSTSAERSMGDRGHQGGGGAGGAGGPSGSGGGSVTGGGSRGPQYMRGQRGGVGRKRQRKA